MNTDVLLRICGALKCDVGDIMEFIDDEERDFFSCTNKR